MSEEHSQAQAAATDGYHFLIHRLHSLTGLIPIGVFLMMHLFTNASVLAPGPAGMEYQKSVERIHALGPLLVPVEIVGIFLPLLFHSIIGFMIIYTGKSNTQHYRYGGNIRYSFQRWTGVIAFFFIMYHVWQLHWVGQPFRGGSFRLYNESGGPAAAVTTAEAIKAAWWVAPVYAVGILASVYHLSNGIWTSLITWGITIRPRSQQMAGYVCAGFGVILSLIGLGALRGFKTFEVGSGAVQTAESLQEATHH